MLADFPRHLLASLWRWSLRRVGAQTITVIFLTTIALWAVSTGVAAEVEDLSWTTITLAVLLILGLLIVWWLERKRYAMPYLVFAFLLGLPMLFLIMGDLWHAAFDLLRAALARAMAWVQHWWLVIPEEPLPPADALILSWKAFASAAGPLLYTVTRWPPVEPGPLSPLVQQVHWSGVLWLLTLWAAWFVFHHDNVIIAFLPAGAVLGGVLAYTRSPQTGTLVLFLGAVFAMLALRNLDRTEQGWQRRGTDYVEEIRVVYFGAVLIAIAGLLTMTAALPFFHPRLTVERILEELRPERPVVVEGSGGTELTESFGLTPSSSRPSFVDPFLAPGLPRNHLIGSGPELGEQVALTVQVEDPGAPENPRYYWRSLTYSGYNGRGWFSGDTETTRYQAGSVLPGEDAWSTRTVRAVVREVQPLGALLFSPGDVQSIDQSFEVAWLVGGESVREVFAVRTSESAYTVEARMPAYGPEDLRLAGSAYPAWVAARYLPLPDTLPDSVRQLAEEVTRAANTPYDRALALEGYLRGFQYNLNLPAPPADRDVVAYFLFELQQGYCDYYASSMVVMARALGIPARLAVGYAGGSYDAVNDRYVVTAAQAHSWPELYFPGYGWIPFEPTAGQQGIDREESITAPPPVRPGSPVFSSWELARWAGGALAAAGLAAGLVWLTLDLGHLWRYWKLPPSEAVAFIYRQLYAWGPRLSLHTPDHTTPYEYSASLLDFLQDAAPERRSAARIAAHLERLTALYVEGVYSPREPGAEEKSEAWRRWRRLRRELQKMRLRVVRRSLMERVKDRFA